MVVGSTVVVVSTVVVASGVVVVCNVVVVSSGVVVVVTTHRDVKLWLLLKAYKHICEKSASIKILYTGQSRVKKGVVNI